MKVGIVNDRQFKMARRRAPGLARSRSFWIEQRDTQQSSGLSPKQFCASHGFAYATFTRWMAKLRAEETSQEASFIRLEVEKPIMVQDLQQQESPDSHKEQSAKPIPPQSLVSTKQLPVESRPIESSPDLKLVFGQGLILTIPKGFDPTTLCQVVEALA